MANEKKELWQVYEDTNGKFGIVGILGGESGCAELSEEDANLIVACVNFCRNSPLVQIENINIDGKSAIKLTIRNN